MRARSMAAIVACSLVWLGAAHAQESYPRLEGSDVYNGPSMSITLSPLHLLLPVIELTGEFRVGSKMGVGILAGVGTITPEGGQAVTVWEAGGQFRYYVIGNFRHGMQLGAEVLYVGASAQDGNSSAVAAGLAAGPFIGYKYTASAGFTLDIQGGVEFYAVRAKDNLGNTLGGDSVIPLLNLNIGWSF